MEITPTSFQTAAQQEEPNTPQKPQVPDTEDVNAFNQALEGPAAAKQAEKAPDEEDILKALEKGFINISVNQIRQDMRRMEEEAKEQQS